MDYIRLTINMNQTGQPMRSSVIENPCLPAGFLDIHGLPLFGEEMPTAIPSPLKSQLQLPPDPFLSSLCLCPLVLLLLHLLPLSFPLCILLSDDLFPYLSFPKPETPAAPCWMLRVAPYPGAGGHPLLDERGETWVTEAGRHGGMPGLRGQLLLS